MYRNRIGIIALLFLLPFVFFLCKDKNTESEASMLQIRRVEIGNSLLDEDQTVRQVPVDQPIVLSFSRILDTFSFHTNIVLSGPGDQPETFNVSFLDECRSVRMETEKPLLFLSDYYLELRDGLRGREGEDFPGIKYSFQTKNGTMTLEEIRVNGINLDSSGRIKDIPVDAVITASFNVPVDRSLMESTTELAGSGPAIDLKFDYRYDDKTVIIQPSHYLDHYVRCDLVLSGDLKSAQGFDFKGFSSSFYTLLDSIYKFPAIGDEELLTLVQERTFGFYHDFAHPVSYLSRDRNTSGETCAIGGSGFGIMAYVVAMERGFISRTEGMARLKTMLDFLGDTDRYHGAWPHWINGTTGKTIPFSDKDDGGDLVETSYLAMGMMTLRQYLDEQDPAEAEMISGINALLDGIQWDWYTRGGENVLYWHWSPNYQWEKNHRIQGWHEALITYIMAASSSSHSIDAEVYHQGWARSGNMINGRKFFGMELPLGNQDYGGPLFFTHYSFLGIDPRNLSDRYADYWKQNLHHCLINYTYCVTNPKNYVGYGKDSWGLTASDGNDGYSAHSPTNDRGVISPTAAISSMVYTPDKSMNALRHFYYLLGDRLWGEYGFYDAFNVTECWWADSYISINQGPIVCMIENYRTALLWDLFMSAPEVDDALNKLDFNR